MTAPSPTDMPSTAISARVELGAAGCALAGGILAAAAGPLVTFGVLGVLLGLGIFAAAAYRPVFATYAYLGMLPILAVVDRGNLIPLVRPNEALLALLLAGAMLGAYLRYCRGEKVPFRLHRLDLPLAAVVLLSALWPLASLMLRGQAPLLTEVVAVLPIWTLAAIYLLVRFTIATEAQLVCCLRLIVWPGAVVAILQTVQFGPLLASPTVTAGYIVICLVLVLCCGARGVLGRRERLALGLVLGIGAFVVGATALVGMEGGFADLGGPVSWLGHWDNLSNLYLSVFGLSLLAAFGWLSVAVLRRARELTGCSGPVGVTASALEICWWPLLVLIVVGPQLTLGGVGDVLVTMLAITTGRLCAVRDPVDPVEVRNNARPVATVIAHL